MKIQDFFNDNYQDMCKKAYKKAIDSQEKLNACVTYIDPSKRLEENLEGKLKGVAIALKDNINTKGIKTTACSRILDNYIPIYDAHIVDLLRDEGAVFIAKTNMDELAMGGTNITSYFGKCHNPYDYNRISGGSSGGSAALVGANVVSVAIGSDTGDSVRKPASFCGIYGIKPSYGLISRYGIIPYASSLDHVGYFTTNVHDAALMLEVLQGRDDRDMTSANVAKKEYSKLLNSDIKGKKVLVFKNVLDAINNSETIKLFDNIVDILKAKGAIVEEVSFNEELLRAILPTYYIIANAEATANHSNLDGILFGHREEGETTDDIMINTRTKGFGPWIKKRFVIGSYALFEENQERLLRKAQKIRRLIVNEILSKLKDADALIAPAAPSVAPLIEGQTTDELSDESLVADNHMIIANFGGLPSMTVPMGYIDGLPIGVNLTSNPFKEEDMFNIALAIEEGTGLKDKTKEVI